MIDRNFTIFAQFTEKNTIFVSQTFSKLKKTFFNNRSQKMYVLYTTEKILS